MWHTCAAFVHRTALFDQEHPPADANKSTIMLLAVDRARLRRVHAIPLLLRCNNSITSSFPFIIQPREGSDRRSARYRHRLAPLVSAAGSSAQRCPRSPPPLRRHPRRPTRVRRDDSANRLSTAHRSAAHCSAVKSSTACRDRANRSAASRHAVRSSTARRDCGANPANRHSAVNRSAAHRLALLMPSPTAPPPPLRRLPRRPTRIRRGNSAIHRSAARGSAAHRSAASGSAAHRSAARGSAAHRSAAGGSFGN